MMMLMRLKKKETNKQRKSKEYNLKNYGTLDFENWFVESPLNKPCTSLFMISIMNVYAYFHLNLENASVEF